MMKTLIIFSLVLTITGCNSSQKLSTGVTADVSIFCDEEKGVEYLIFDGYNSGGMTVRYNINGSISKCNHE